MFILCYYYYYHHYNIYIFIYLFLYVGFSCLAPSSNRVLRRLPKPNGMPTALNEGEVKPWMVAAAPTLYICTRRAYGVHHTRAFSHRSRCLACSRLFVCQYHRHNGAWYYSSQCLFAHALHNCTR